MLRPDETDKIRLVYANVSDKKFTMVSGDMIEDIIKAINLAGYKLVKEDE